MSPRPTRVPLRLLAALAIVAASATAQQWQLPDGGVAIYEKLDTFEATPLDGQKFVSAGGHAARVVPVLFESELTEDHRRPQRTPLDLHGVGARLAFDLTTLRGGTIRERFPAVPPYGDLILEGRAEPIDGQGLQRFELVIRRAPVADGDAAFKDSMDHYQGESIEGTIGLLREWDAQRGVVPRFTVTMDVRYTAKAGTERYRYGLEGSETWTLVGVREPRDATFAGEVNAATDRAVEHMLGWLGELPEGTLAGDENPGPLTGPALLARTLRALADAGVGVDEPLVAAGLERLGSLDFEHTRALAEAILAVSALRGHPVAERDARLAGGGLQWPKRRLPATEQRWVQRWTDALLGGYDQARDPSKELTWGFRSGASDHTYLEHTALAADALLAAQACGVRIPRGTWPALVRGLLRQEHRSDDGGWSYRDAERNWPQGPTTAAVVQALLGLREELGSSRDRGLRRELDEAVRRGHQWLAQHFEPRIAPSPHSVFWQHHSEWTEFLPGALERGGVEELGGRDWYFEFATVLMAMQRSHGGTSTSIGGTPAAMSLWRRSPVAPQTGPRK